MSQPNDCPRHSVFAAPSAHAGIRRASGLATARLAALAGLLGLLTHAGAAPVPAPAAPRPRPPVLKASLSNGLRLLSQQNDSSEIVSIVCQIRAGLPDEREDQAGLAALTAEALLKGTTTHPGASWAAEVARAGGNLRTQPGFDFTEVSIVTSKDQFEPALKLIADTVAHPRFDADEVLDARNTLKRRIAAIVDDFSGASYQTLLSQLYSHNPYGRPLNGYAQTLDRLTAADVRKFWQASYVQNRMVVAVVGDIDAARGLSLAQKAFEDVPFQASAVTPTPEPAVLARPRAEMLQRSGPAAQVMVGYLAPGATRTTYPVYAVLDAIAGEGKRSRLFTNIREKRSIGYDLGAFYQPLLFQSHLVGYVVMPPSRPNPKTKQSEPLIDPVKGYILDEYRQLALTGPTDAELARARSFVVGRYALRQERTRDQAKWLSWYAAMGLGADFNQYLESRVATVTKEEIQAAAKKCLTSYALVVTVPDSPQPGD